MVECSPETSNEAVVTSPSLATVLDLEPFVFVQVRPKATSGQHRSTLVVHMGK